MWLIVCGAGLTVDGVGLTLPHIHVNRGWVPDSWAGLTIDSSLTGTVFEFLVPFFIESILNYFWNRANGDGF